jgi:hypothetical protein
LYPEHIEFVFEDKVVASHPRRRLALKHRGGFNVRIFGPLDQFLCMAFARLTYRESLRDIEACPCAQAHNAAARCQRPYKTNGAQ